MFKRRTSEANVLIKHCPLGSLTAPRTTWIPAFAGMTRGAGMTECPLRGGQPPCVRLVVAEMQRRQ